MRRTKVVCTIGPASIDPSIVRELTPHVDVFRINFSHGDKKGHQSEIKTIRAAAKSAKRTVAILQDLPGPKIRVGKIRNGSVELQKGSFFVLGSREMEGDEKMASVNYPALLNSLRKGDPLYLADGVIRLRVEENNGEEVRCSVVAGGLLSSGRGVNAPRARMKIDYPTAEDVVHLKFGLSSGVDMVALSFVRSAADVKAVKRLLPQKGGPTLIAKIEKAQAVSRFDSILDEVDGVMVARGDLGIETPIERVPVIQKEIIRKCNKVGKPVIVATQMLMSMVNLPMPSRAEVTDVTTAILDGTDAVMLSDETAVGKYPVDSVRMLDRIARSAERVLGTYGPHRANDEGRSTGEGIGLAACELAEYTGAKAIVAPTQTGSTARLVSKYRPRQPILALCTTERVARKVKLYWGVVPLVVREEKTVDALFASADRAAEKLGLAEKGEKIVVTSGTPGVEGTTNLIKVSVVGTPA